jgi:hypothetical protein
MSLTIITVLAGVICAWLIMRKRHAARTELAEPRGSVPVVGIQIICGNCAGEQKSPVKTYLDRFGRCSLCGGHSYILAAVSRRYVGLGSPRTIAQ